MSTTLVIFSVRSMSFSTLPRRMPVKASSGAGHLFENGMGRLRAKTYLIVPIDFMKPFQHLNVALEKGFEFLAGKETVGISEFFQKVFPVRILCSLSSWPRSGCSVISSGMPFGAGNALPGAFRDPFDPQFQQGRGVRQFGVLRSLNTARFLIFPPGWLCPRTSDMEKTPESMCPPSSAVISGAPPTKARCRNLEPAFLVEGHAGQVGQCPRPCISQGDLVRFGFRGLDHFLQSFVFRIRRDGKGKGVGTGPRDECKVGRRETWPFLPGPW